MARTAHRGSSNTHTKMAKVVYATTDGENVGFGTSLVPMENVDEEIEKRRQQYREDNERTQ